MKKRMLFLFFIFCFVSVIEGCKKPEEEKGGLSKSVEENEVSVQSGKVMEQLTVVGEDGPYYCNLEENMTGVYSFLPEDYPVLVCKDPVYDITYYVNYGRDYFIYAKRGDVSECVVEIPARDLYCREGVLYFRAEDYGLYKFDSFADGAVLSYDPVISGLNVVIDESTFEMVVYPDGILYTVIEEEHINEDGTSSGRQHEFFYSFENKESKELPPPMRTVMRWKEYQLVAEFSENEDGMHKDGYRLETPEGESAGLLPNLMEIPVVYRMKKDGIYYLDMENLALMFYDVETGEKETLVEIALLPAYPCTFLVYNNVAYFSNGIRYSFADNIQYKVEIEERITPEIHGFYTDGEELFILVDGMLWIYEEKKVDDFGVETALIPGRAFRVGCYEAVLHPLGE